MRLRVIVVGAVLLALVSGGMVVRARSRTAPPSAVPTTAVQAPVAVAVAAARRTDVATRVLASGSVTSIRDAKIGSKISGRVAAVLVEEGQQVGAGTPLLRLDTRDLEAQAAQAQANAAAARARLAMVLAGARPEERRISENQVAQSQAGLRSAQASLSLAQANMERMRSLNAQGAVSKQDLDTAETQSRVAQAQVAQAQAQYDSARQNWTMVVRVGSRQEDIEQARAQLGQAEAGLAAIQVQLQDSIIRAPFAGTITQRHVEPGEVVSSSSQSALFVLSEVSDVFTELVVPAQHRSELQQGQVARVTVDGLPGKTFEGRVEEIKPAAEMVNRTFGVKVRMSNRQAILRPGMFARGAIVVGVRHGVLQIPEQAVMTATAGPVVFVVGDGRAAHRAVTLGDHHDGLVEVTSGLADGDKVVVQGQDALADHQRVTFRAP